ncbi:MAG: type II toxin-antitoxin system VapC family toxin [Acidimicrobiales bacterium]
MIVVDTSVWIDVLNGTDSAKAMECVELIDSGFPVALTDIVLTEVLQGLRSEHDADVVEAHLLEFPILRLEGLSDFSTAAKLYRGTRRVGITILNTLNCLIAAPCVRVGAPLLHADADFDRLASCTALTVW